MFWSNVEFVPLIGLILKEGTQGTWYKGFWPRSQPASSRTGSEAKQSDSKTCALDCLGAGGPSYILIMANRAGPRWQGCRGIILHWGNQGPVQGNLRSQGRMTAASKTGCQQPFSATQRTARETTTKHTQRKAPAEKRRKRKGLLPAHLTWILPPPSA